MKLAEATTEEVAMETNAAYGLRARDQLQTEQVLVETNVVDAEYDFVLPPVEQVKLAEATTEEVAMETNAAYGLRARDQLQIEQVLVLTNVLVG